jgi:small subunit ribosomal protein S28e
MVEEPKKEDKPVEAAPAKGAEKPEKPAASSAAAPAAAAVPAKPEDQRKFDGFLAEVVDIIPDKTGMFGSVTQVMAKILEGRDKGRVIRKNLTGRVKRGDQIRLADTSREDKPINVK